MKCAEREIIMDYKNADNLTSATATTETKTNKYDKDGRAISIEDWAQLMEDRDYTRVAWTEIGKYVFSTVWLGLDHSFGDGPPLIFESMAFKRKEDGKINSSGIYQARYSTLKEAKAWHYLMILIVLWREFTAYSLAAGSRFIKGIKNWSKRS